MNHEQQCIKLAEQYAALAEMGFVNDAGELAKITQLLAEKDEFDIVPLAPVTKSIFEPNKSVENFQWYKRQKFGYGRLYLTVMEISAGIEVEVVQLGPDPNKGSVREQNILYSKIIPK